MASTIRGVVAAVITPIDENMQPDLTDLIARIGSMLAGGCDGINLLGTTGEATSFSLAQRAGIMRAVAAAELPMDRIMVGTGAASLGDAVELSKLAAELKYATALLLPPFYYKPISDDGLIDFVGEVVDATSLSELPIFLYNFPALSGISYTPLVVELLLERFGTRIAGLKDSSGDIEYAEKIAAISSDLSVFPSNEAILLRARAGDFAGCISATANLNHKDCGIAFHQGDKAALDRAVAVRNAFGGYPLVPGIKATLARLENKERVAELIPPLARLNETQSSDLKKQLDKAGLASD